MPIGDYYDEMRMLILRKMLQKMLRVAFAGAQVRSDQVRAYLRQLASTSLASPSLPPPTPASAPAACLPPDTKRSAPPGSAPAAPGGERIATPTIQQLAPSISIHLLKAPSYF